MGKIRYAIKNPKSVLEFYNRKSKIEKFLDLDRLTLKQYFDESHEFWKLILKKLDETGGIHRMSFERLQILYVCIRHFKPKIVVETGVAGGATSLAILFAMHKNNLGKLYSIDIGITDWFPSGYNVGYLVPDEFRQRWNLTIGDSKKELPLLLESLEKIDLFFHDSDHSFEHMMFEFNTVFPYLKSDKIILSDDVNLNSSFTDFSKKNHLKFELFFGFGILKNHIYDK
jgi:hypothetical protein